MANARQGRGGQMPTVGDSIPPTMFTARAVQGMGFGPVRDDHGLDTATDHLSLSLKMARSGSTISNHQFWAVGKVVKARFPAGSIWPGKLAKDDAVYMDIDFNPSELTFMANSKFTDWASGSAKLAKGEIQLEGGTEAQREEVTKWGWSLRFAIEMSQNVRGAAVVLHLLPMELDHILQMPDQFTDRLPVLKQEKHFYQWEPLHPDFGAPGPSPYYLNARSEEAKAANSLPPSLLLKTYIKNGHEPGDDSY